MQTRFWMRLFKNNLQLYLKGFQKGKNESTAGTNMSNPKTYMCTHCRNEANTEQSPGVASGQNRVTINNNYNKEPAGNKEHRPIHIQQDVRGEQRTDNQKTQNRCGKETGRPNGQVEQINQ
ncbi:hypothetical protein ILYODFUR_021327 [Ilyodon furcidens]|uniref:Uncharacterized protein n=1 Tax=Ilyodon furcidens TaxID=33524 RepID=A0ABV0V6X7_9TELE